MPNHLTPEEDARYAELQQIAIDAARSGDISTLEPMLKAGLPPNLADHKGNTLLMLASYNDQPKTIELLIDYEAEIDRRNNRGQTPLAGVAFKGFLECARILLQHGADPEAPQGHGQTPTSFAAMFGRTEVLTLLQGATTKHPVKNRLMQALAQTVQAFRPKHA